MNAQRTPQMFPKPPKRMKQPRKDDIRWRAELAEAEAAYAREMARQADRDSARILAILLVVGCVLWAADRLGWLPASVA